MGDGFFFRVIVVFITQRIRLFAEEPNSFRSLPCGLVLRIGTSVSGTILFGTGFPSVLGACTHPGWGLTPNSIPKTLGFHQTAWTLLDNGKRKSPDFSGLFVSHRTSPDLLLGCRPLN
jgi:hypothetical protein